MHCINESSEDRKKPQEHVLKRKTREDGRYVPVATNVILACSRGHHSVYAFFCCHDCRAIIQNVILAAKEVKKKEPEKEETKPKLGAYRPGSWMQRAKKKTQFKVCATWCIYK